jgi:hypothetical protein
MSGFWSYAHADDDAEGGRIADLARAVAAEYEMQMAEELPIFLDRDSLNWGDDWEERVDEALVSGFFFIPVLTPRYFQSEQCRRELQVFLQRAQVLNLTALVLPIRYIDFAALNEADPSDDLLKGVQRIQWEDWAELRLEDSASSLHRKGVAKMAKALGSASVEAQAVDFAAAAQEAVEGSVEYGEEPGFLDRMARTELALPDWQLTMGAIMEHVDEVGRLVGDASGKINTQAAAGKGFAARLTVARQLAESLEGPAQGVLDLSRDFTEQLTTVDSGFRIIIERASEEIAADPSARTGICDFFEMIRGLAGASREGLGQFKQLADSVTTVEHLSMDLRPPLRKFRQGVTVLADGIQVTDAWVRLIDESGIDCSADSSSDPAPAPEV